MEVLGAMVKQNKNIRGISIGNMEIKYSMFADDSTFFRRFPIISIIERNN